MSILILTKGIGYRLKWFTISRIDLLSFTDCNFDLTGMIDDSSVNREFSNRKLLFSLLFL